MSSDSIGIPYAPWIERDGVFIDAVRCPVCNAEIPETTDRDGEKTSSNYQEHYADEHMFNYVVTVETDTEEHADQVMVERLSLDDDYGFDYTVSYAGPNREMGSA